MSYEDSRGSDPRGPQHSGTQTSASKSSNRGGGGSNYNYRNYGSNPNIRGNWNTGGPLMGHGNITSGVTPLGTPAAAPRAPGFGLGPPRQLMPAVPPLPGVLPAAQRPEVLGAPRYDPLSSAYPPQASVPLGGFYPPMPDNFPPQQAPQTRGLAPSSVRGQTQYKNQSWPNIDPSENYGNDQFGSALSASQRLGQRAPNWGGMGSGGNRWGNR